MLGVGSGSHAQQTARVMERLEPVLLEARAGRRARARRRQLDDGRGAGRRPSCSSRSATSRPGCAASTARCPRRSTASSPTRSPSCSSSTPRRRARTCCARAATSGDPLRRQHDDRHAGGDAPASRRDGSRAARLGLQRRRLPRRHAAPARARRRAAARPTRWPPSRAVAADAARRLPGASAHARARSRRSALPVPPGLRLLEPLGYLDFLGLVARAAGVLTDSGGIQEETTYLGVPCFTLRDNTERPVTVELGHERPARPRPAAHRRGARA